MTGESCFDVVGGVLLLVWGNEGKREKSPTGRVEWASKQAIAAAGWMD